MGNSRYYDYNMSRNGRNEQHRSDYSADYFTVRRPRAARLLPIRGQLAESGPDPQSLGSADSAVRQILLIACRRCRAGRDQPLGERLDSEGGRLCGLELQNWR